MSTRLVVAIARHEARTLRASPLLFGLVLFAAFATLAVNPAAMIPSGDSAIGGVRPFSNSRYAMAQSFSLTGLLFYTFLTSILAGLSVPRDEEARVGDLIHSTPLTASEYIGGKFLGVLGVLSGAMVFHVALAIAWYEGAGVFGSDAILGPFSLLNYVAPALVFLAPGVLFCAGVGFAVGAITRSPLVVYALPTALFAVTLGGLIPRPASGLDGTLDALLSMFDLWGARWLSQTIFHADRGALFYNAAPLAIDAPILLNRLFVVLVPVLAVVAASRHWGRQVRGRDKNGSYRLRAPAPIAVHTNALLAPTWRELTMVLRPTGALASAWEMARIDLRQTRSQPGAFLFIAFAMLLTLESAGSARGVFDSQVILTSGGLAVNLVEVVGAMGCLLLLFHIVESLDRGRTLGVHALIGSTPVPTGSILLGSLTSGGILVLSMLTGCGVIALALMAIQGKSPLEVWPFVLVWGPLLGPTFVVWACAVSAVFALIRDRYATYVIGLAFLMGTAALLLSGSMTWVTNWPLWGALLWSDLGVLELDREAIALNRLTVMGTSVGLAIVALKAWPRIEADATASAGRRNPRTLVLVAVRFAPFALLALLPGQILSTRIDAGHEGKAARAQEKEYWRLNSATWVGVPPPAITHVEAKVDLEPPAGSMTIDGAYTLLNDSGRAIDRMAFTVGLGALNAEWTIDGKDAEAENRSGLHVLSLARSMSAGESIRVGFAYQAMVPRGITRNGGGASEFIKTSGVVLSTLNRNFLPAPGFVEGIGVDHRNRAEPGEMSAQVWKGELPPLLGSTRSFTSRMEVTAPAAYIVNGVGEKIRESSSEGRTTVVWESKHPVRFLNLVAGRWSVRRQDDVAVFYHPSHEHNVEEMLKALAASRRRYSDWFGPYPWKELRLSEYANHATRAQGFPTNIPFSEGIGFLTQSDGLTGLPTIVTAHETAHQWWAHLLTPGRAPGADVLIEAMAHYSTLRFLEAEHGRAARINFATTLESRYALNRRADAERPLARIIDTTRPTDETAIYDKGAWVLWMLEHHLGSERMLEGLRSFIRRFEGSSDHAALQDLIEELRPLARSPSGFQEFVDRWFFDVVIPEFEVREVTARQTPDGWLVSAVVENVGTVDATIEVAVVGRTPPATGVVKAPAGGKESRARIRLSPGRPERVTWTTVFPPDTVVVDPDAMVLQLNRLRARATIR